MRLPARERRACAFLGVLIQTPADAANELARRKVACDAVDPGSLAHAALQRDALARADESDDGYALVTDDESARWWRDRCRERCTTTITLRPVRDAAELRADLGTSARMLSEAGLAAIEGQLGPRSYADPILAVARVPIITARSVAANVARICADPELTWSTRRQAA
jgi:hypothetical protein